MCIFPSDNACSLDANAVTWYAMIVQKLSPYDDREGGHILWQCFKLSFLG